MTKMKTTNHKRLQQYEHHYGMVFLTGMLGCRWHRYQQSQEKSSKCDICWYVTLLLVSVATVFWFYFWLLATNSADDFNWFVFRQLGKWKPYYNIIFILICTTITYIALLIILSFCHIGHRHQVHIHWTHRVVLVFTLTMCVISVILICELWPYIWRLQRESLMITGPFLHLSAVILMTLVTWFIAGYWLSLYRTVSRVLYLGFYIGLMLFLYVVPVLIQSPCITEDDQLPAKPALVGHRGAAAIRPENTALSFTTSWDFVIAVETDVRMSVDGVPFLMHDSSFKRTTDVSSVFPDDASYGACWFNISSIEQLDAGSWFLKKDPFHTASSLTEEEKSRCRNQTVPRLSWLLQEAKVAGAAVMFDLAVCGGHPYSHNSIDVVINTIIQSGIDLKQIWWIIYHDSDLSSYPILNNMTLIYSFEDDEKAPNIDELLKRNVSWVNIGYGQMSKQEIRSYQKAGVQTNIYTVNSDWLYSLYWCMGVDAVTTDRPRGMTHLNKPVWALTPREFRAMWIAADVVSAALVILMFVVQHLRRYGKSLAKTMNSERMSLQGAKIRMSHVRKNRNMKEKLLHTVEGLQEVEPGILGLSSENIDAGFPDSVSPRNIGAGDASTSQIAGIIPNRLSTASGWSGISGISAISGTGVGDSSFTSAPPSEQKEYQKKGHVMTETPAV